MPGAGSDELAVALLRQPCKPGRCEARVSEPGEVVQRLRCERDDPALSASCAARASVWRAATRSPPATAAQARPTSTKASKRCSGGLPSVAASSSADTATA